MFSYTDCMELAESYIKLDKDVDCIQIEYKVYVGKVIKFIFKKLLKYYENCIIITYSIIYIFFNYFKDKGHFILF